MTGRAHRRADGRFFNPWADSELHTARDILRFVGDRRNLPNAGSPGRPAFPTAVPSIVHPRAAAEFFTATWIGHSSVLLQVGGLNILTDPVFSQRAFPLQWLGPRRYMAPGVSLVDLPPIDVVLQSHNHYDHLDRPAVKRLAKTNPQTTWVVPLEMGRYVRRWGVRNIVELDWWEESTVDTLRVTAVPARHFSGRTPGDRNRSLWCGHALEIGGFKALFAGDTAYHPDYVDVGRQCGPFDLVMIPIGAYDPRWFMHVVHIDPEESVRIYQDLTASQPAASLPMMLGIHWGTFRLTQEPMDEPPRRTRARWEALALPPDRLWIAAFGETKEIKPALMVSRN